MSAKLNPVGSQFQVNLVTINEQSMPEVTPLSDGRFVVVYRNYADAGGSDIDIIGQVFNANGTLAGAIIPIATPSGMQSDPAVAARSGTSFTTVWQDFGTVNTAPNVYADIYYAVSDVNGFNIVNRTLLMDSQLLLQSPDIATMPDSRQIIVAQQSIDDNNYRLVFDVIDANGTTQLYAAGSFGSLTAANNTRQWHAQVAGGPKGALVVYEDNTGEASSINYHITVSPFDQASNMFLGQNVIIADASLGHSDRDPDIAYIGSGRYVIVYDQDQHSIFAKIYDPSIGALSPEITVSAAGGMGPKVAATPDGGFVVTWQDYFGPAPDPFFYSVHERRFDPYGNPFGDDFVVNTLADGSQFDTVLGISKANVLTLWTDSASRPGDTSPTSVQGQAAKMPVFDYDSASFADFDHNGRSDLLFQNVSTGAVAIWTTNGNGVAANIVSGGSLPPGFKIGGTGDFNSTPGDDILLRSAGTGEVAVWATNGTSIVDFKVLGSAPAAYRNAGIGDFTGDGQSDLLFRHTGTGEIASWQVVDNALAAPAQVLGSAPNVYQIVGVADFTGDHQADILFRNVGTGEIAEWQVANNQLLSAQVVGSTASSYHVAGTGDFDGNGANDILFRHDDGEVVMWLLDSAGQLLTAPQAVGIAGNQFHIDGTGDLNGDGRDDIIFRDAGGTVIEWLMNGAVALTIQTVGGASQDFAIAAHHFDLI